MQLSCSEHIPASHCHPSDRRSHSRGNVMRAEICFRTLGVEGSGDIDENRLRFDSWQLWARGSEGLLPPVLNNKLRCFFLYTLWRQLLAVNAAPAGSGSKGLLHRPWAVRKTGADGYTSVFRARTSMMAGSRRAPTHWPADWYVNHPVDSVMSTDFKKQASVIRKHCIL